MNNRSSLRNLIENSLYLFGLDARAIKFQLKCVDQYTKLINYTNIYCKQEICMSMQLPLRCFSKSPMAFQTVSWDLWVVPPDPAVVPDILSNLIFYLDINYNPFKEIVSREDCQIKSVPSEQALMIFKIFLGLFLAEIKCKVMAC
jgi:hypothetical protein